MHHDEQVRCSRRLLESIRNARPDMAASLYRHPVADYTCAEQLRQEKAKLFMGQPVFAGFSNDVAKTGDYFSAQLAGVPVLVVRARDGRIKAFLNICKHRAAAVADGRGECAKRFVCPYHGWAYDTDGAFVGMTMEEGFVELDRAERNLQALPVQEQYGMIWLGLQPGVPVDVDGLLQDFKADFAAYGFESYHHYKTIPMQRRMNWKMVIDTFLENYHLKVLHRNTIGGAILSDVQLVDASGSCARLIQARRSFAAHVEQTPEAQWDLIKHSAIGYVLFPNTFFIVQSDHVEIWRAFPDGDNPNSTQIFFDVYVPEPALSEKARQHWDKNIEYGVSIVLGEDFPLSEKSQVTFGSGAVDDIVFGRNEPGLIHYHKAINRALGLPEVRRPSAGCGAA